MTRFSLLLTMLFGLITLSLSAQTVLSDADHLAQALTTLTSDTTTTQQQDTAKARIVAILSYYANDPDNSPKEVIAFPDLLGTYAENPALSIYLEKLKGCNEGLAQTMVNQMSAQRTHEKPLRLLHGEITTSPADYLSIMKTVQDYQQPPLSNLQALKSSTNNNASSPPPSLLNQEAIIEGLFLFLTERAGEEVMVTYLQRLLNKDIGAFKELFPTVIAAYGNYRFTYTSSFLANLRDAFYADLQVLDIRLVELFSNPQYFTKLQNDPIFQNIMSVYLMYALVKDGVPVLDAMPTVHSYLYQRYLSNDKRRNLFLADSATTSPQYTAVATAAEEVVKEISKIYYELATVESKLLDRYQACTIAAADSGATLTIVPANDYFGNSRFSLRTILGTGNTTRRDLTLLPSLLRGHLTPAVRAGLATVSDYDQFYANPPKPGVWQAAGLAMARRLCGEWYQQQSIDQLVQEWRKALISYDVKLLAEEQQFGLVNAFEQDSLQTAQQLQRLATAITATTTYWGDTLTETDKEALSLLNKLTTDFSVLDTITLLAFTPAEKADAKVRVLRAKKERLSAVETRWETLYNRIAATGATPALGISFNPVELYKSSSTDPLGKAAGMIKDLQQTLNTLDTAINALDERYVPQLSKQQFDAQPMLQITDLLTNWMYSLQANNDTTLFVSPSVFGNMLQTTVSRDATLGLIGQQLNHSDVGNRFSGEGLRLFTQATLQEFATIPDRGTALYDSLGSYYVASFATHTVQRILSMPLLQVSGNLQQTQSFVDRYPKLADVNSTAQDALDLVYNLKTDNHRRALDSFIKLLQELTELAFSNSKEGTTPNNLLNFVRKYGPFISGLVDADRAEEVEHLLKSIADPPGSSQIKRQEKFSASINGYVGLAIGHELLDGDEDDLDTDFLTLAPTLPIGISFSWLSGGRKTSWSTFLSIIDLGALASYNLTEDLPGENDLNFRNIFKPGLRFDWNLPRSPFYLGVGGQYGPQYREVDGVLKEFNSTRFFLSFGVDVAIKRLW